MATNCNNCGSAELVKSIDLGSMPIAHRLKSLSDEPEECFPLSLQLCKRCGLIQIAEPIDPEVLYRGYNYCFSTWKAQPHAVLQAKDLVQKTGGKAIFEVACNDGMFMELLREAGCGRVAGVEPNAVAASIARGKGFPVYEEMLTETICRKAVEEYGPFSAVVARQVVEHLPDLQNFFSCAEILLSPDGCLFIDVPDIQGHLHCGDVTFIWEEHVNYFTEDVLRYSIESRGFRILSMKRYAYSGGIMEIYAKRDSAIQPQVPDPLILEKHLHLFTDRCRQVTENLKRSLSRLRSGGWKVTLYGVGCRASTLVNGLSLNSYIDYALDDQEQRRGMYMAGGHIHIRNPESINESGSPLVCLLAVNQENDQSVKVRISSLARNRIHFVSMLSPADILNEVASLDELQ